MENWDARQSQHTAGISNTSEHSHNIVELESHRHLHDTISELIYLTTSSTLTTSDLQYYLHLHKTTSGKRFTTRLVRALLHTDKVEREAVVWLLTLLNDRETITPLQQIAQNERLARTVRLSASLALAGMGATREMMDTYPRVRLYAIS